MKKRPRNYSRKVGLPPESLVYTGNRKPSPAEVELLIYDEAECTKHRTRSMDELIKLLDSKRNNLLIINNLTDITLIENIGKHFGIQPMILEDVLNTAHMPRLEESGDQLILTLKIIEIQNGGEVVHQHVTLILGDWYVIVFKDVETPLFREVINRIAKGKSRARQKKADYLFYLLTDTLIDSYYSIVEQINDGIDKLEERLLEEPRHNYIQDIYRIKQTVSGIRGVVYPVREALLNLVQGDFDLVADDTLPYLQDVRDHVNHIIHMFESGRDTLSDLIDLNSSNINNRLNGSMNVLAVITTLFIPLTLIAGIYGMNFKFMPELQWKGGYPFAGMLMLATAGIMYFFMKRKKLL
jgi:magnesium transporter